MTEDAAGTPSWVELSTKDPEGSNAFYSALFGWSATPPSEQHGGYRTFLDGDQSVAGLNPMGEFPAWTTYVATDDADATTEKVRTNGGTVVVEPMDVDVLGRMAVFVDRAGAAFGVGQAQGGGGRGRRRGAPTRSTCPTRSPGTRFTREASTRPRRSTARSSAGIRSRSARRPRARRSTSSGTWATAASPAAWR